MASTVNSKQTALNGDVSSRIHPCKKSKMENKVAVVLGAQWGDEGKGKVVDLLAVNCDIVCRCQVSYRFIIFLIFATLSLYFFIGLFNIIVLYLLSTAMFMDNFLRLY